jgi:hypothetical protein
VPYGQVLKTQADGTDYGVLWEDARDIFRVVVTFAEGAQIHEGVDQNVDGDGAQTLGIASAAATSPRSR